MFTLVMLAGSGALSMNIILPSLPAMTAHFGTSYAVMQLAVSGTLAASAVMQLLVGPVSDRFGRRPVMIGALLVYILATIGALMASHVALFLAFRWIQAALASGMVLSRAVVRDTVPGPQAASRIGYVTMGMSVVPMIAPALGGLLQESFGWQASFWLMLAMGVAVLALVWLDMGETATGRGVPMRAQIASYPVLARSVRFWGYALAATLGSGAFFAYVGGAPFVGIELFGLSPAQLGWWFGAPSLGYFVGNFLSGRYSARFGINRMVLAGGLVVSAALSLALFLALAGPPVPLAFFGPVVAMGLGNGLMLPSANAGMMSVRPELAGTASGLGGAMAIAGGALMAGFAATQLEGAASAAPLLEIMLTSALGSVAAVLWVIRREAVLRRRG